MPYSHLLLFMAATPQPKALKYQCNSSYFLYTCQTLCCRLQLPQSANQGPHFSVVEHQTIEKPTDHSTNRLQ